MGSSQQVDLPSPGGTEALGSGARRLPRCYRHDWLKEDMSLRPAKGLSYAERQRLRPWTRLANIIWADGLTPSCFSTGN